MIGLALVTLMIGGDPAPVEAGLHRGVGFSATDPVPEPPFALALVIVAAAGMRVRERRRAADRPGAHPSRV